jgi:hypothetical protein
MLVDILLGAVYALVMLVMLVMLVIAVGTLERVTTARRNAAAPFPRRPASGERTRESVADSIRLTVMVVAAGYLFARSHGRAGTAAAEVVLVLTVRMIALAQDDR